jgi:bla regulator protein BlaR1
MWSKVLNGQKYYPDLAKQQEEQAKKYLESIGRDAKVSEAHVEKKLPSMNVDAQNQLFAGMTKYDQELNNFPYWLGTRELLQNGTRYIYKTEQGKTADGYDLITFTKSKEDGTAVKVLKYKIVGSEPQLID